MSNICFIDPHSGKPIYYLFSDTKENGTFSLTSTVSVSISKNNILYLSILWNMFDLLHLYGGMQAKMTLIAFFIILK